ncbi:hypothetical protein SDRG_12833 [Saprolegnia diclina VS20]|uniref:Uncharacterized protein n=1 Tax=Saprolegnia diclina (strain VS20) TaxID=1156394 RepID=T0PV38_SAPDV|nr:hypothetical protein SDRG_12833 [Saprolegnia diclina VS20]EQC29369.1 hypothetical protein SDRG_12833 [Saprolegnia diclina VS20]|eukprot:XP_008617136.1 hypothetical protein SDRG_12833 [Saprolegnia diclina VS20]
MLRDVLWMLLLALSSVAVTALNTTNTTSDEPDLTIPTWHAEASSRRPVEIDLDHDDYLKELGLPSDDELNELIQEAEAQQAAQADATEAPTQAPSSTPIKVSVGASASDIHMRIISVSMPLQCKK